jgi:hypothetical protein
VCKQERLPATVMMAVALLLGASAVVAGDLGDPTRPSYLPPATQGSPKEHAPAWRVESIIVSAGRRLAVVNGRVVGVNDQVAGARILEILPYEVRLEYQGEIRHISLVPTRVKRPVN